MGTYVKPPRNGKLTQEGKATKAIEKATAGIPSMVFLGLAGAAIAASVALRLMGRKDTASFVGDWAPTILLFGVYHKLAKVMGSETPARRNERGHDRRDVLHH